MDSLPQVVEHDLSSGFGPLDHGTGDRPWIYHAPSNTVHLGTYNAYHYQLWPQATPFDQYGPKSVQDFKEYPDQGRTTPYFFNVDWEQEKNNRAYIGDNRNFDYRPAIQQALRNHLGVSGNKWQELDPDDIWDDDEHTGHIGHIEWVSEEPHQIAFARIRNKR